MTTQASPPALDEAEREAAQARTLKVLVAGSIFSRAGMTLGFAVAVLILKEMLGDKEWLAGLSTVAITVGTAASAALLSRVMARSGRRPGLTTGFLIATVGGLVALLGAQQSQILVFLFGLVMVGVGAGASNLARYAAADLAAPKDKAKAISLIVWAATLGAVGGPALVGWADQAGQDAGLNENVGPYALTVVFYLIAAAIVFAALRPDPLVLVGGINTASTPKRASFSEGVKIMLASPMAKLALISLVVSQAVMVGVMAMTPLHMKAHDHDVGTIGLVLSAHTAGMFAFAPLAGWAADRLGQVRAIAIGGAVLMVATAMTALAGEAPSILMFPGLYLLGLGWSFGMVAGSALLTQSVDESDRVTVQGAADLMASIVSGVAALASGIVLDMAGFHILSMAGILAAGVLLVSGFARDRQMSLAG